MLEDSPVWVELVERILNDADIRVTPAFADSQAKSALLAAAQVGAPVDLVLSDIRHPEVGGIEFLRWMRSLSGDVIVRHGLRACKLPLVFISASISQSEMHEAFTSLEVSDVLFKSNLEPTELLRAIDQALTSYRQKILTEFQNLGMAIMYEGGRYALTEAYAAPDRLIETPHAIGQRSILGAAPRRLILASDRLSLGERSVEEFEYLLNQPQTTETDLQRFFVRCPEFLLGADFAWFWPEPRLKDHSAGKIVRPDFGNNMLDSAVDRGA